MKAATRLTAIFSLIGVPLAFAQGPTGSLVGSVLHPDGSLIADAPVWIRNEAMAVDARTRSSAAGRFEFPDLPGGTYVVSVQMPCCDFIPYKSEDVVVTAGVEGEFDIHLVLGELSIEGDDPATVNQEILSRQNIPDLPAPRTVGGRPDLSGVWLIRVFDPYPQAPKALPWAQATADERIANSLIDHPHTRCLPGGPPVGGAAAFIAKIVQTPDVVVLLMEDYPGFRQMFLDGREHPDVPNPSWMGHSIGRWENDTLVVDTVGFNDRGWIGAYPRTEQLRMEERYRRLDYGHLEVQVTFEDPGVLEEPWVRVLTWDLAPQEELIEYVCENNKWGPNQAN